MSLDYAAHSPYTDPGPHARLLDALPDTLPELTEVVRNVIVHYTGSGLTFTAERLAEIDNRWVERILDTDQSRFGVPLAEPRPLADRVAGCCRDYTLLTVAALRQRGVPARSRIGFAPYMSAGFVYDHVVAEYWTGDRWALADAQLDPAAPWPFDPLDIPRQKGPLTKAAFTTAAGAWTAYRRGEIDPGVYGVAPGSPYTGPRFIGHYVLLELAHRRRDELLLWDTWGEDGTPGDASPEGALPEDALADLHLTDEIAALLLSADEGDDQAEETLAARYRTDPRLNPGDHVLCLSPSGTRTRIDLTTRTAIS
ncbi:transglutaminase domain-containing protein [Bailinhaonella thermotolerans]|uniref:Transglutaminase domain-containing protein n=1 Tax=Bailinhaonella thermotolerans TaxID=1070861 RepID=A0A3A4B310_9ACTN|nr:transglutaminase domain-containing protein [Bailinhaonella thermotolerans]RJL31780.1 transglutaminase domain-containing protein [Bailinhaonella thermotolerans]